MHRDRSAKPPLSRVPSQKVWAYLALVCLRLGRQHEAEQAQKFALQRGLRDPALLNELRSAHEQAGTRSASGSAHGAMGLTPDMAATTHC